MRNFSTNNEFASYNKSNTNNKNCPSAVRYGQIGEKHSKIRKRNKSNKQSNCFYPYVEFDDGTYIEGIHCSRNNFTKTKEGSKVLLVLFISQSHIY